MNGVFDYPIVVVEHSNHLPHWYAPRGIYFVTFRLYDSLPEHRIVELRDQRRSLLESVRRRYGVISDSQLTEIESIVRTRIERDLDRFAGHCFLKNSRIARVVADALHCFDEQRYDLFTWAIMPNHVHVVFEWRDEETLDKTIHSWKSFTAKRANEILGRVGEFWECDYYDRLIRCEEELFATVD
ncbi:MAG TPA: transposase, partial [Thermoanaerobaculia bacterium]